MNEMFLQSSFFGCTLSLGCYWVGTKIAKRFPYTVCNPLLIASALVIGTLCLLGIDFQTYDQSAGFLTWLLTPATVCLAVPMYRKVSVLKKNIWAILGSLAAGCAAGAVSVLGLCLVFHTSKEIYASLLPKSITTAIAMGVSKEIGGISTLTVGVVVFTGLLGAVLAKTVCRVFRITHPVAVGLACGNAAHAIGTSKALEIGEVEGAMSSLAIVVAGIFTVVLAPLMAMLPFWP
ncbi:LrgB family protein [Cuneatibacter caecimuris]|uniref:Putative murein hydrolase (TIGR00659 family) n=1 Tax=Cuneatibacter caecimuris TaxID=1796618 RepID=A0A4Q7NZB1_9FIRM|nr:LrgB family protein [Cuneatibacter caecimuris]RZS92705.1 putative murein hydrolase (TIGR00659 family) [Cuneatibacter caecimuris]